eukprot:TRINITY_DN29052_c0_g1_i1.p1 TRINITY_DN29052_c0_g1~~TRINITY_DN29052_c0_g1_i1.p1  ORF type:complete len:757 (-),score=67.49 TRINITY_DN29052_c0_g1_i1:237-2453(-)
MAADFRCKSEGPKLRSEAVGVRVLITGATGLLGRQVLRQFDERGWRTRGLGLSRAAGRIVRCDLLNPLELAAQIEEFEPSILIHCAAERRPDVLEEDRGYATKINVDLTRELGKVCRSKGIWLVYISTNYVFDGKNAPYAEDAVPRPVNTYGESKLAGERALVEVCPQAATVRVPVLYGPIEYIDETSVTALLGVLQKQQCPKFDNWQERYPTSTVDFACVLEAFAGAYIGRSQTNPEAFRGCFHWQGNARHTKYTMALDIAEIAGIDTQSIISVDTPPAPGGAPRPQFERMLCTRMEKLLESSGEGDADAFRSDMQTGLREHLKPFLKPSLSAWLGIKKSVSSSSSPRALTGPLPAHRVRLDGSRVLVTGATGLLGRQVMRALEARGWSVRGLGFSRATGNIVRCNLFNADELSAQFASFQPTIVIHCAAERRPDVLEKDEAFAIKINVDMTRTLAEMCEKHRSWLVYMSTNYVFDGKDAPYAEDAKPNPVNTYGRSKYLGEQAVTQASSTAAILRVPLLYGPLDKLSETSITALLECMLNKPPGGSKYDNWQERFPTSTEDLARVLEAFIGAYVSQTGNPRRGARFSGVFHWQSNERQTKYSMACTLADIAGIDKSSFVRVDDAPPPGSAPRPQYERMLCSRMERTLESNGEGLADNYRSAFREELARCVRPFLKDSPTNRQGRFLSRLGRRSNLPGACLCFLVVASASLYAACSLKSPTGGRETSLLTTAWRARL